MHNKDQQRSMWFAVVVIAVVAIVGYYAIKTDEEARQAAEQVVQTAPSPTGAVVSVPAKPAPTSVKHELTYQQALSLYGSSGTRTRIQFSGNGCSAQPGAMTVKQGTKVMLDNRGNQTRTYRIGKQSARVAVNDFAIMTMTEIGDLKVLCDGGGSGIVTVKP
jgi:hypothetical protein